MSAPIRVRAVVQPGGKVEITAPELQPGQTVDVLVTVPATERPPLTRENLLAWLDSLPPSSKTAEEWKQFERDFQEMRNEWDR